MKKLLLLLCVLAAWFTVQAGDYTFCFSNNGVSLIIKRGGTNIFSSSTPWNDQFTIPLADAGTHTYWYYNGSGSYTHDMYGANWDAVNGQNVITKWSTGGYAGTCAAVGSGTPVWTSTVNITNSAGLVNTYTVTTDGTPSTNGLPPGWPSLTNFNLGPGAVAQVTMQTTNSAFPQIKFIVLGTDGTPGTNNLPLLGMTHMTNAPPNAPPPGFVPFVAYTNTSQNIFLNSSAPTTIGVDTYLTNPVVARQSLSALTSDALQRAMDTNSNARFSELQSLLIANSAGQARRDAIGLQASIDGLGRVAAQTKASGDGVVAAINSLHSSMLAGTVASQVPTTNDIGGFNSSAVQGLVGDLVNIPTNGTAVAPVITLPFHSLHDSMADVTMDFGDGELATYATWCRNICLVMVTVLFSLNSYRLFGRAVNV